MKPTRHPISRLLCPLMILLLLCGCTPAALQSEPHDEAVPQPTVPNPTAASSPTEPESTEDPTTLPPDIPEHSELYIPGVSVEDVIVYFREVCLDAEFASGGDATRVQKWMTPIYYTLSGSPTDADLVVLADFTQWLNAMPGFPGIHEAQDPSQANLRICFCSEEELLSLMGEQFIGTDGAVSFWYLENAIYDAIICCRTDLDQSLRNSVILEELYNGLGPVQDTSLRTDSIIYAGFSSPQALTPVDQLILRLLYHPQILCGMDAAECEAVIRSLYY